MIARKNLFFRASSAVQASTAHAHPSARTAASGPLLRCGQECRGTGFEKHGKRGLNCLGSQISHTISAFIILGSGGLTLPAASLSSNFKRGEKMTFD